MKKTLIILFIIVLVGIGFAVLKNGPDAAAPAQSPWDTGTGEPVPDSYDLSSGEEYQNDVYGFSFRYPVGFSISNFPDGLGGSILIVQSVEKAQGFQIAISPFDEPEANLTADMIRKDIPDLDVREPQDLLLGETGKGVAFLSDNESFAGNSREVWFVYRGNLYQISTYARLDPLLQSVLATWKFE